jgi:Rod binding domain-containing protein
MSASLTLSPPGLSPLDLLAATQASGKPAATIVAKAKDAAQNFEAVFLNSMFQNMFTGIDGEGPFGGSGATGVWRSMLTDQYARSFAKAGGIGIAPQVYQTLLAHQGAHS